MAKKDKKKGGQTESVLFDVLYEDGTRTSNRRVNPDDIQSYDKDGSIRRAIEAQDKKIAEQSGMPRGPIKSITPTK